MALATDVTDSFRNSLMDVITVIQKLLPYCERSEDLLKMVELAATNDGQLRLLMERIAAKR